MSLLKFRSAAALLLSTVLSASLSPPAWSQTGTVPLKTPGTPPAPLENPATAPAAKKANPKALPKRKAPVAAATTPTAGRAKTARAKNTKIALESSAHVSTFNVPAVTVSEVRVAGNRRIEKDAILEKMKLKAASALGGDAIQADIQAIFSLGFFEDVRFDLDGTALVVSVKERPVVASLTFAGSEEFESKDLEEAAAIKNFTVLNLAKIRAAQTAIAKKYEEKGYYLARAEYEVVPVAGKANEVQIAFRITENEKVRIRRIFFFGNKHFTSGDLKQSMITAEGHAFSFMTSSGTYREDAFERDLAVLAYTYGNDGYMQAKFSKPRVTLSQDRRFIDIMIDIDEGPRFYLGTVKFKGSDLLFSESDLAASFGLKEKAVFSTGRLQEEVIKMTDKYGDEGYAFANVIPKPEIRPGTTTVDLEIDIEKGEKVYWGQIKITGNAKTHDKVIRRELPFFEGELYNATKRKRGVERVRRLGFFGNDVNFLTSTPQGSSNVLDLEIRVADKPTGTLNVSAGYGSGTGFVLQGQISQNNLFGLGQQLAFSMQFQKKGQKEFSLQFTDPKAFDSEWSMGGDIYLQNTSVGGTGDNKTYDQRVLGGALRVGREISEDLSLFGTYKLSQSAWTNEISQDLYQPPLSPEDKKSTISSVVGTLTYDTRNNRLDPSGGIYSSASAELAGLGGRVFQKYLASVRYYTRPFWKFTFRSNLEYGLLTNSLGSSAVPGSERFSLGGIFNLRGYPWSSVGPTVTITPTREGAPTTPFPYVIGGTNKFVFNQEVEFPLIPEADIRSVLFFDAGQAWNSGSNPSPSILANYGWGIRWYSPLGPLRFEWGFPLSTISGKQGRGSEFNFVIAPVF